MRDMLGRHEAISYEEALGRLMEAVGAIEPAVERVSIYEAIGRVAAGNIVSLEDLPGFIRSTVDGYALRARDTYGASETSPMYLDITGEVRMGEAPVGGPAPGACYSIPTGGMLPEGTDAALMLEHAQAVGNGMIEAQRPVAPGENVIRRGEDLALGEMISTKGTRLGVEHVAMASGTGAAHADVYVRPRVAVISTGDEVRAPGEPLALGQVRDVNSLLMRGYLTRWGAEPVYYGIVGDEYEGLLETVERAAGECQLVLVSGGSSVGARDQTERVIEGLGRVLFHSVRIRPGKPTLAGVISGGLPIIGLPGHPRAVHTCLKYFVRPAVRVMTGMVGEPVPGWGRVVRAVLSRAVESTAGRLDVINVVLEEGEGSVVYATPVLGKSGLLFTILRSHGAIEIPVGVIGLEQGSLVDVRLH